MPPLGSPFDDASRKPRGAERPELKQPHRGTPADPQFPEAYRSEGKEKNPPKRCVCSFANVDGFIHRLQPPPLAPALLLFIPAQRDSAKSVSHLSAPEPGDGKADRCLVTSGPARRCREEDAGPLCPGWPTKEQNRGAQWPEGVWSHCVSGLSVPPMGTPALQSLLGHAAQLPWPQLCQGGPPTLRPSLAASRGGR